jgi:hypothetical protein
VIKRRIKICQIKPRLSGNAEPWQVGLRTDQGWRVQLAKNALDIVTAGADLELTSAIDRHPKTGARLWPTAWSDDIASLGLNALDN